MSATGDEPCPLELVDPLPTVTFCSDSEKLIKFVELKSLLGQNDNGQPYLLATAIRKDDLKVATRSVSTLRLPGTPTAEIIRRGLCLNREAQWANDPLAAIATVASLRDVRDGDGRREICVFAEPTSAEEDTLGPCQTHAGIKRSSNPPSARSRLDWAVLRGQVALCFSEFVHICSALGDNSSVPEGEQ